MKFTKDLPKKRGIYFVRKRKRGKIYMAYVYRKHGVWWAEMGPDDACTYAFGLGGPEWLCKEVVYWRTEESVTIGAKND